VAKDATRSAWNHGLGPEKADRVALTRTQHPKVEYSRRRDVGMPGVDRQLEGSGRPRRVALLRAHYPQVHCPLRRLDGVSGVDRQLQGSGGKAFARPGHHGVHVR
jgi:hypothetical protein